MRVNRRVLVRQLFCQSDEPEAADQYLFKKSSLAAAAPRTNPDIHPTERNCGGEWAGKRCLSGLLLGSVPASGHQVHVLARRSGGSSHTERPLARPAMESRLRRAFIPGVCSACSSPSDIRAAFRALTTLLCLYLSDRSCREQQQEHLLFTANDSWRF